jgi:hypothetical protein
MAQKLLTKPILQLFDDNENHKQNVTREDIAEVMKPTKPCFILHNVLTEKECKLLIKESESVGFEDANSYCHMYRDRYNDRLMSDDKIFSDVIYERVKHLLPQVMKPDSSNIALRSTSTFKLDSLNNRWRYCRYQPGHFFGAHTDGSYSEGASRSLLTFMMYLNGHKPSDSNTSTEEDIYFTGGATNFLSRDRTQTTYQVVPKPGMALVFLQEDIDMLHEGEQLNSGKKYILRTDVMYVRQ